MRGFVFPLLVLCLLVASACSSGRRAQDVVTLGPTVHRSAESAIAAGVVDPEALPKGSEWRSIEAEDGASSYGFICDDRPVGFWTYTHANGQVSMQGDFLYGGIKDGPWTMWWPNGRRMAEGNFDRGQRHGEWQQWHENGRRATRGTYSLDRRMGHWVSWWENGRVESRGFYTDNRPSGRWQFWDRTGDPMPVHTHSHPGVDFPADMNPRTIQADGREKLPEPGASAYRPGRREDRSSSDDDGW